MSKELDGLLRPYKIESKHWGQSIMLSGENNGMLMVTACDFDSGSTVTAGLDVSSIDVIVEALHAIQADAAKVAAKEQKAGEWGPESESE